MTIFKRWLAILDGVAGPTITKWRAEEADDVVNADGDDGEIG